MRALLILFALTLSTTAFAQTRSVVVLNTPDGFELRDPSDVSTIDGPAILLSAPQDGSGGWVMVTLDPGDEPTEVLAQRENGLLSHHRMALRLQQEGADRHRIISRHHRARLGLQPTDRPSEVMEELIRDGEIIDVAPRVSRIEVQRETAPSVRFEVDAALRQNLDVSDPLVTALAEDDALGALNVRATDGQTRLGVTLKFETVAGWRSWMDANAETLRLLRERADGNVLGMKLDIR